MKQCVAFVVGLGMPGTCPEHLQVSQERPGWPGHFEVPGRESVVVQSLQGHLWFGAGEEFLHGGTLCLLEWHSLAVSPCLLQDGTRHAS